MVDLILDTVVDTLKLLPFLYVTYVVMEYLEEKLEGRSGDLMRRAGRYGPLCGGLLGVVPQCGFSAAVSSLYAGGVVTVGTLLAVYLSTSDEMLPILISRQTPLPAVLKILGLKALIGVAAGFLVDLICRRRGREPSAENSIGRLCEDVHCHCHDEEKHSIFLAALRHTLNIAYFLLILSFLIHLVLHWVGEDALGTLLRQQPVVSVFLSALVGLIPNCAASVAITTLYLDGLLSFGSMMAGLLVGAGVGLLVLFKVHKKPLEDLKIVLALYVIGVVCGGLLDLLGVVV